MGNPDSGCSRLSPGIEVELCKSWTSPNNDKPQIQKDTANESTTLRRLTQLKEHLPKGTSMSVSVTAKGFQDISSMIQKYDCDWKFEGACNGQLVQKERVVVTGTTGALGSHLLSQLLSNDKIEKVWAMNRRSSKENRERQVASFKDKLLDENLLKDEKLVFVDADLESLKLGLGDDMYNEIRAEATIIIHNAWEVSLSLDLKSFEPNIHGARNLLELAFCSSAQTGPPRFVFASSITVAGFSRPGIRLNEAPVALEDAANTIGYGQSKLVTEKLLESARRAGLQTCIARIGQLSGDIKSGSWSTTDWVPSLISTSISLGYLPEAAGVVSWLPLDVAATSIIDTCVARDIDLPLVVHVSHPRPVPWMDILEALSKAIASRTGSNLPIIHFDEWNKALTRTSASLGELKRKRYAMFPITRIKNLLNRAVQVDNELRSAKSTTGAEFSGLVSLDTTVAESLSEALRSTPQLGAEHVDKWIRYWESTGLFKSF
ncbi:unnamed protein product [Rhizoctonia solani]|uniref:Thioester reductase (TE) domain-containing protein n=1 Tax=Rhizoctonia solani TaxID=456999 RepID=A0A8H2Y2S1_9AGAM|nr:unnamed protein product [Rhizoctonia solani]